MDQDGLPILDDVTFERWRAEAQADPPDLQDWADLVVLLRWAADLDRRGYRNSALPLGMTAVEYGLRALLFFLQKQQHLMNRNAVAPFLRLHGAIVDLADGRISPLFRPVRSGRPGAPGKSQIESMIMGLSARAMTQLMNVDGVPMDQAARQVAHAIRLGRIVGYGKVKAETVKNWRARIMEGPGSAPKLAIDHYNEPLPAGMSAKDLLARLGKAGARYWAESQKTPD